MVWEMKEGTGTLFKNGYKDTDAKPDDKGTALIGGVEYEIASWTKEGRNGPFQSLRFKLKGARPEPRAETRRRPLSDDIDDSIPF